MNVLSEMEFLFWFGAAVIAPLSFRLTVTAPARPLPHGEIRPASYRAGLCLYPLTLICTTAALLLPYGTISALLASVWLIQTLLFAAYGLTRWLPRPVFAIEESCIDAGLIFSPVSAIWLIASCAGFPLLTFDPVFTLLTAVHFTYITLGALVITGLIGRRLVATKGWKAYRILAGLMIVGVPFVAAGITFSQFTGRLLIETLSVLEFAGSLIAVAILAGAQALPRRGVSRFLLIFSFACVLASMSFALAYALGRFTGAWTLSITDMVRWHGWLNAFGFVLCGLLGWSLAHPEANLTPSGIPFSRFSARGKVGQSYFQRVGAVETDCLHPPTGIVDRLEDYRRDDFDVSRIDPAIAAFYEQTASHELLVYPEWQRGFYPLARLYKKISQRVGQMNFPLRPESRDIRIASAIVPLKDAVDGRNNVRGWIRTYIESNDAVYVAAYANHKHDGQTYMNIAFPLPFGNLTSILRVENLPNCPTGLRLTSFSARSGDQGVYVANRLLPIRMPINETIDVYPARDPYPGYPQGFVVGDIVAEHRMWLLNRHCLTLHYSIKSLL